MQLSKFNDPWSISFKDGLAIAMCLPFIIAAFKFLIWHMSPDLELLDSLKAVIMVVLGGYFGQETATAYFTRGNNGGYGGYYGSGMVTNASPGDTENPV